MATGNRFGYPDAVYDKKAMRPLVKPDKQEMSLQFWGSFGALAIVVAAIHE